MKDLHAFGCPVFALQNALASGNTLPRWSPRARLGLNLGQSPLHARNVNLVLSLSTGLVSPQYHCTFDEFFETTQNSAPETSISSIWQQLAGLVRATGISRLDVSHVQLQPPPADGRTVTFDTQIHDQNDATEFIFEPGNFDDPNEPLHDDLPQPHAIAPLAHQPEQQQASGGVSSRGRQRTLSRAMQDSIAQKQFYGS